MLMAVLVHAGNQQLPGSESHRLLGPVHRVEVGGPPSAIREDFPFLGAAAPSIDRDDNALATEALGAARDQARILDRCCIDRDLIGAELQQPAHVRIASYAATNRKRDEHLSGSPLDHVEDGGPIFMRRSYVEKY